MLRVIKKLILQYLLKGSTSIEILSAGKLFHWQTCKISLTWEKVGGKKGGGVSYIIPYAENVTCFFNPNMMFSPESYVETLT